MHERFCNGNPENDVKDGEYIFDGFPCKKVKDWDSVPEPYSKAHCLDFYGGDLEGIRQKIPYLKKLGVTALYLNPIFYAATVHKYDCLDYFSVDPHFGGDKALSDLTDELHKNGIRIILDVSINHTGIANKWFNRDGTFFPISEGAFNNPSSTEREFYFFEREVRPARTNGAVRRLNHGNIQQLRAVLCLFANLETGCLQPWNQR